MDPASGDQEPSATGSRPAPGGSRRSARRIGLAVGVALAVLVGLAWWVLAVPYSGSEGARCSTGRRQVELDRACDRARHDRRQLALVVGAGVAIVACAVSTVPSRRLTGDELGPLR